MDLDGHEQAWTRRSEIAGSFGMQVSGPNVIALNSADSRAGLANARELVEAGMIPEAVTGFDERDAREVFGDIAPQ